MKTFHKHSVVTALVFSLLLGFSGPATALAATTPDLAESETYGILSNLFQHNIAATTITGNPANSPTTGVLGYSSEAGVGAVVVVNGTTYVNDATWTAAGVAQNAAKTDLDNQTCTSIGAIVDLATYDTDGPGGLAPGTFPPGCYSSTGAMDIGGGGTVTLSGSGTYIFRPVGALNTTAGSIVSLSGASSCDVFWTPTAATTLGANSTFRGTIIDPSGVTMSNLATVDGRVLAYGGTVTADTNSVTVPSCTAAFIVNKVIVNDDGGSMTIADFPLFVGATAVTHGVSSNFAAGVYTVSETTNAGYTQSFSGNCDANGVVTLTSGANAACTITNDDIEQPSGGGGGGGFITPPLIDVVKVPSPLALPNGPGGVTYSYTVRNIGPVAMTNVTTVDDSCGPLTLVSGDSNANATLEVSETWSYTCSTTLSSTHTNTVTATGWANGMNAVDVAVATVVVGEPIVPPLIHVTKVPNPLFLPVAGGLVTYTERITNPGVVPLANVTLVDDKCSPLSFISGDVDGDALLDTTETWTYTCSRNLTQTTTNTATATGQANGITVTDFAIATVIVGVPGLPETGIGPGGNGTPWAIAIVGMLLVVSMSVVVGLRKRTI